MGIRDLQPGDRMIFNGRGSCAVDAGTECVVIRHHMDGYDFRTADGSHDCWEHYDSFDLIEGTKETTVSNEQTQPERTLPQLVIIVKNTEVFKKGGVFEADSGSYSQVVDAYQARQYAGQTTISSEQVELLLHKKVAVEAVRFNPEYVTLEQNEALQKALESLNKPAKKKTSTAKTSKKA